MPLGGTYATGNVVATNGSVAITGTGVLWNDVIEGDHITIGGRVGIVDSVLGGFTTLNVKAAWSGPDTVFGPMALTSISNGTPAIFTSPTPHNLAEGDTITLTTTSALPTGLATLTTYFMVPLTPTTFKVSLTRGGTTINTTGPGAGTHSFTRTGSSYIITKMSWLRYDPALTQSKLRELLAALSQDVKARVSIQFDKVSDVTLGNVPELAVNVVAGKSYRFRAILFTTSNVAAGVKAAIGGSATASFITYEGRIYHANTILGQARATALAAAVAAVTAVTVALIVIEGTIVVNASGTLTVQFAQNASNGAASSVLINSSFDVLLSS